VDPEAPPQLARRSSFALYLWIVILMAALSGTLSIHEYVRDLHSHKLTDRTDQSVRIFTGDLSVAAALVGDPKSPAYQHSAEHAIRDYSSITKSTDALRRMLVVEAVLLHEPAGQSYKKLLLRLDKKKNAAEIRMWHDLARGKVSKADVQPYIKLIGSLRLGLLRHVAEFWLYGDSGDKTKSNAAWQKAKDDGARLWSKLALAALVAAVVLLGGLVLILAFGPKVWRFLRALPVISIIDGTPLIKAFLVYFVSFEVAGLVMGLFVDSLHIHRSATLDLAANIVAQIGCCWLAVLSYKASKHDLEPHVLTFAEPTSESEEKPLPEQLPFKLDSTAVIWGLGGFCAAMLLVLGAGLLTSFIAYLLGVKLIAQDHPIIHEMGRGGLPMLLGMVSAVILAPITEEIAFRGLLLGSLRTRYKFWPACLLTSAVFALIHPTIPVGFLGLATLGMVFCVLREKTGNLITPMVCHACNNLVLFILQFTVLKSW